MVVGVAVGVVVGVAVGVTCGSHWSLGNSIGLFCGKS